MFDLPTSTDPQANLEHYKDHYSDPDVRANRYIDLAALFLASKPSEQQKKIFAETLGLAALETHLGTESLKESISNYKNLDARIEKLETKNHQRCVNRAEIEKKILEPTEH